MQFSDKMKTVVANVVVLIGLSGILVPLYIYTGPIVPVKTVEPGTIKLGPVTTTRLETVRPPEANSPETVHPPDVARPPLVNPVEIVGLPLVTKDEFLIKRSQYVICYNREMGRASWVAWKLSSNDIGTVKRQNDFRSDNMLPIGWHRATNSSYEGSGFDRGHLCPSEDRSSTIDDNRSTFYYTNIVPQSPDSNEGPWKNLESHTRMLVHEGNVAYIVAGTNGIGGEGRLGKKDSIDNGRIMVPSKLWKIILILSLDEDKQLVAGKFKLSNLPPIQMICIIMENEQNIAPLWMTYKVKLDDVEKLTSYVVFNKVR